MGMNPDDFWYQQPNYGYDDYTPPWWHLRARWRLMPNAYRLNSVLYVLGAVSLVVLLLEVTAGGGGGGTDLDAASRVTAVPTSTTTSTPRLSRTTTTKASSTTTSVAAKATPTT